MLRKLRGSFCKANPFSRARVGGRPGTVSPSEHRPDSSKPGPVSQLDPGGYESPWAATAPEQVRASGQQPQPPAAEGGGWGG